MANVTRGRVSPSWRPRPHVTLRGIPRTPLPAVLSITAHIAILRFKVRAGTSTPRCAQTLSEVWPFSHGALSRCVRMAPGHTFGQLVCSTLASRHASGRRMLPSGQAIGRGSPKASSSSDRISLLALMLKEEAASARTPDFVAVVLRTHALPFPRMRCTGANRYGPCLHAWR